MSVALLTDFGADDIYVGVMKGVMLGIDPTLQFIDLTHGIEPQNVRQAALALMNAQRYFPQGTVFLVVVDPGVGSTRRPIAVKAGGYAYVAPDNGVLSYALSSVGGKQEIVELRTEAVDASFTFHGRDVFAPAAARIARGDSLAELGQYLDKTYTLPDPQLQADEGRLTGEVVHIDHFGNLVTSIGALRWSAPNRLMLSPVFGKQRNETPIYSATSQILAGKERIYGVRHTYSEAERGGLLALVGSTGFLEISVNQGSAARRLDVAIGDTVVLELGGEDAAVSD